MGIVHVRGIRVLRGKKFPGLLSSGLKNFHKFPQIFTSSGFLELLPTFHPSTSQTFPLFPVFPRIPPLKSFLTKWAIPRFHLLSPFSTSPLGEDKRATRTQRKLTGPIRSFASHAAKNSG
jgi:hypothetical protein